MLWLLLLLLLLVGHVMLCWLPDCFSVAAAVVRCFLRAYLLACMSVCVVAIACVVVHLLGSICCYLRSLFIQAERHCVSKQCLDSVVTSQISLH